MHHQGTLRGLTWQAKLAPSPTLATVRDRDMQGRIKKDEPLVQEGVGVMENSVMSV